MMPSLVRRLRNRTSRRARQLLQLSGVRRVRRVVNGVPFVFPLEAVNLGHLAPWNRAESWEEEYARAVLGRVRRGDQVVDIGAHYGIFTLLFADRVGPDGKVVACEPNPNNRKLLEATLRENELAQAQVAPQAVTNTVGTARFSLASDESTLNSSDGVEVETTTLDELCKTLSIQPDVVKIDVEGFEPNVLDGAQATVDGVRMFCIEVHPRKMADATGVEVEALLQRFEAAGFEETFRYKPEKHLRDSGRPFNVILERVGRND